MKGNGKIRYALVVIAEDIDSAIDIKSVKMEYKEKQ